jgi:hypothetical protein
MEVCMTGRGRRQPLASADFCVCPADVCPSDVWLVSGQEKGPLLLRTLLPTSFIVFVAADDC